MRYRILNVVRVFADPTITITGELWKLDPQVGPVLVESVSTSMDARANDRRVVWMAVLGAFKAAAHRDLEATEGARQTEQALEGAEFEL